MTANVEHIGGEIRTFLEGLVAWSVTGVPHLVGAIVLLIAGWWLAHRAERGTRRILDRQTRIDPTLRGLLSSLVRYSILIVVVVAVLGQLGIQTTSILAAVLSENFIRSEIGLLRSNRRIITSDVFCPLGFRQLRR